MNRLKRILLGITVLALCLSLFAGQDPEVTQSRDIKTAEQSRQEDKPQFEEKRSGDDSSEDDPGEKTMPEDEAFEIDDSKTIHYYVLDKFLVTKNADAEICLKDLNGEEIEKASLTSDDKGEITLDVKNGKLTMIAGEQEISGFTYNGAKIRLKDGELYIDGVKLTARSSEGSGMLLGKDYTLLDDGNGKLRLLKNGGSGTDKAEVTADDGRVLTIELSADRNGLSVKDADGKAVERFCIEGVSYAVSSNTLTANGRELARTAASGTETSAAQTTQPATSQSSANGAEKQDPTPSPAKPASPAANPAKPAVTAAKPAATAATTKKTTAASANVVTQSLSPLAIPSDGRNVKIIAYENYTAQMLPLINKQRASKGLKALSADPTGKIYTAAKIRAEEYALYPTLSHTRPAARGGGQYQTVFKDIGLRTYLLGQLNSAENLANGFNCGDENASWAFNKWMASASHAKNIEKANVNYAAICRVTVQETKSGYRVTSHYWVMLATSDKT